MCINTGRNGMLLELSRHLKRGEMLEVRWTIKGRPTITVFEVCWSKSFPRGSGRRSYHVGCRRIFSTDDATRLLRPPVWS